MLAPHAARAGHRAAVVDQQLQRRTVIEDGDAGRLGPLAHQPHVFRTLQRIAPRLAVVAGRIRIAPLRQAVALRVGLVEHPCHPVAALQIAARRFAAGHRRLALGRRRVDIPDAGAGRRRRARRAAKSLVGEHDARTTLGGADRRPCAGGAATEHQHIGLERDAAIRIVAPLRARPDSNHEQAPDYTSIDKSVATSSFSDAIHAIPQFADCEQPRARQR